MVVDPAALGAFAAFPSEMDRDWVGRACHLSAVDRELAWRRADQTTRMGFAVQLVTVRAIGTFLPDPTRGAGADRGGGRPPDPFHSCPG